MECKKCLSLLCEYKDGELGESVSLEMKHHLESCSVCSAELEAMRNISEIIASVKAPEAPADFEDKVIKVLDERARAERKPVRIFSFVPSWRPDFSFLRLPQMRLAAAALLIIAGVFYAGKNRVSKEYYSDILISDAELNEFDSEIMNIFYGEI